MSKTTWKILAQSIVGQGGVEFMKYESRVASGKVVFSDATGNITRLEKWTKDWWFDHIFKFWRNAAWKTRIMDILDKTEVKIFMQKTFWRNLDSFGDFENLIWYIIKNWKFIPVNKNGNIEYSLDIWWAFLRVISKPWTNSITTISF